MLTTIINIIHITYLFKENVEAAQGPLIALQRHGGGLASEEILEHLLNGHYNHIGRILKLNSKITFE